MWKFNALSIKPDTTWNSICWPAQAAQHRKERARLERKGTVCESRSERSICVDVFKNLGGLTKFVFRKEGHKPFMKNF